MLDPRPSSSAAPKVGGVVRENWSLSPGAFVMLPGAFQSRLQAKPQSPWECQEQTEL